MKPLPDGKFCVSLPSKSQIEIYMTGITAKRNSVSGPKTANSCGLTLSAAIRRIMTAGDNPKAAIPETVIIGDRGLAIQGANFAQIPASQVYTLLYINPQILRSDNEQQTHIAPNRKPLRNCGAGKGVYGV